MNSHYDDQHRSRLIESLREKAERLTREGKNKITAGDETEEPLFDEVVNNINLRQLPFDEHGVIRISVGGSGRVPECNYCVFRGDPLEVKKLLKVALDAMEEIVSG